MTNPVAGAAAVGTVVSAVSSSGAIETSGDVAQTAIETGGSVAEAIVHEVGESYRNDADNTAAAEQNESTGSSGDTSSGETNTQTLINRTADILEKLIDNAHELALNEQQSDLSEEQKKKKEEEEQEEIDEIEFVPQTEGSDPEGLFANFGDETLGTDGKPIFGGRPNVVIAMPSIPSGGTGEAGSNGIMQSTGQDFAIPAFLGFDNTMGVLAGVTDAPRGAQLVRSHTFHLNVTRVGGANAMIPIKLSSLSLVAGDVGGKAVFAQLTVAAVGAGTDFKWSARTSVKTGADMDALIGGSAQIEKSSIVVDDYAVIGVPVAKTGDVALTVEMSMGLE